MSHDYRCTLAALQATRMDKERIKRETYVDEDILVVNLREDEITRAELEMLRHVGDRLNRSRRKAA